MPKQLFSNNADSTLGAQLAVGALTLNVAPGEGAKFQAPADGDWELITLTDGNNVEIVKCTARSVDTLTIVRAQEGTTARQWEIGESVSARATKGTLEGLQALTEANAAAITVLQGQVAGLLPDFYDYGDRATDFNLNVSLALTIRVRVTANITITLTGSSEGKMTRILLVQDGTGGRVVSFANLSKWPDSVAPALSTGANKTDMLGVIYTDTVTPASPEYIGVSYATGIPNV